MLGRSEWIWHLKEKWWVRPPPIQWKTPTYALLVSGKPTQYISSHLKKKLTTWLRSCTERWMIDPSLWFKSIGNYSIKDDGEHYELYQLCLVLIPSGASPSYSLFLLSGSLKDGGEQSSVNPVASSLPKFFLSRNLNVSVPTHSAVSPVNDQGQEQLTGPSKWVASYRILDLWLSGLMRRE